MLSLRADDPQYSNFRSGSPLRRMSLRPLNPDAMFDLEKAIAAWRHQFLFTPTIGAADLEEMERHLRDQVEVLRGDEARA